MNGQSYGVFLGALLLGACASHAPAKPAKPVTYAENQCGGASPAWSRQQVLGPESSPNRLSVTRTGFKWNGFPMSRKELLDMLRLARREIAPYQMIVLVAENDADCRDVRIARDAMNESLDCKNGPNCAEMPPEQLRKFFPDPRPK